MKQIVEDNARKGMATGALNKQDGNSGSKETGACLRATRLQHHVARSLLEGADEDSSCQVPNTNGPLEKSLQVPLSYKNDQFSTQNSIAHIPGRSSDCT